VRKWTVFFTIAVVVLVVLGVLAATHGSVWIYAGSSPGNAEQTEHIQTSGATVHTTANGTSEVAITVSGLDNHTINLSHVSVIWDGPTGTYGLGLANDSTDPASLSGQRYAYRVVTDVNDSAPVLDSETDEFVILIRPETFTDAPIPTGSNVSIVLSLPQLGGQRFEVTLTETRCTETTTGC
jgi:hypothetical protein